MEDTLNNSNELFLTFRKEMEEMSKKTKRLEKENQTLTRKHDSTNRNILEMAEERTRDKEDLERLRKQEQQMRNIIKSMQQQGRGGPIQQEMVDEESSYDEEYDDEDEEYGDEEEEIIAEEEALALEQERQRAMAAANAAGTEKPVFGPVPPPELGKEGTKSNGTKMPVPATAGLVNGVKH